VLPKRQDKNEERGKLGRKREGEKNADEVEKSISGVHKSYIKNDIPSLP